jgi:arginine decarboxylase-like protein
MANGSGFLGEVTTPHYYRTFFTNTLSLQFTGSEIIIKCAILKDPANPKGGVDEQCGIAMSPNTAKALMLTLKTIVDQAELGGLQIPVSTELTDILKRTVEESNQQIANAKKST